MWICSLLVWKEEPSGEATHSGSICKVEMDMATMKVKFYLDDELVHTIDNVERKSDLCPIVSVYHSSTFATIIASNSSETPKTAGPSATTNLSTAVANHELPSQPNHNLLRHLLLVPPAMVSSVRSPTDAASGVGAADGDAHEATTALPQNQDTMVQAAIEALDHNFISRSAMWVLEPYDMQAASGADVGEAMSRGLGPTPPDTARDIDATAPVDVSDVDSEDEELEAAATLIAEVKPQFGRLRNVQYGWAIELEGLRVDAVMAHAAAVTRLSDAVSAIKFSASHMKRKVFTVLQGRSLEGSVYETKKAWAEAAARERLLRAQVRMQVLVSRWWRMYRERKAWPFRRELLRALQPLEQLGVMDADSTRRLRLRTTQTRDFQVRVCSSVCSALRLNVMCTVLYVLRVSS
jgi:hypothetical protein